MATLVSQSARCLALILFLYNSKKAVRWVWPFPGSKFGATAGKLLRSASGPLPQGRTKRPAPRFLGSVADGGDTAGQSIEQLLGNGVLASGGDTRFVLLGNLAGTYAVGLPVAVGLGLFASFGFFGVFAAKVLEEGVKAGCFLFRFFRARWYEHALKEEQSAKDESQRGEDPAKQSQGIYAE